MPLAIEIARNVLPLSAGTRLAQLPRNKHLAHERQRRQRPSERQNENERNRNLLDAQAQRPLVGRSIECEGALVRLPFSDEAGFEDAAGELVDVVAPIECAADNHRDLVAGDAVALIEAVHGVRAVCGRAEHVVTRTAHSDRIVFGQMGQAAGDVRAVQERLALGGRVLCKREETKWRGDEGGILENRQENYSKAMENVYY